MTNNDFNCMSYWFPRIEGHVPVPETYMVSFPQADRLWSVLDGKDCLEFSVLQEAILSFAVKIGWPCFLRTGQTSGKHSWCKTCFLEGANIQQNMFNLIEFSACAGLISLDVSVWAVRKMLPVDKIALCNKYNNMPLVKECRVFIEAERVLKSMPYWPREAVEQGMAVEKDTIDKIMSSLEINESDLNTCHSLASAVGACVKDEHQRWSVDCLKTTDGWYVTDMAMAERSWGWEE